MFILEFGRKRKSNSSLLKPIVVYLLLVFLMKEKIYNILCVSNIVLFTIALLNYFEFYLFGFIWLVVLIIAIINIKKNKNLSENTGFNIIIFLLTPLLFHQEQWLSNFIFLIYFLLPVFLPYEKLSDKQLNWNFWILFISFIFIPFFIIHLWEDIRPYIVYYVIITLIFPFITFLIKKKYWIIFIHLLFSSLFIYKSSFYLFVNPFKVAPIEFVFDPFTSFFTYLILAFPFIFTTFSLIFVNLSKKKELIEK